MDTEKLLNIVNTYNDGGWHMNSYRHKMFEEYIKDFMKRLNADCKKAGWKRKENFVKLDSYKCGEVFCLISPKIHVVFDFGKFDLLKYIQQFEENKEMIRAEALKFAEEIPNLFEKFDPLIKEYIDFMKERPAFIENKKIKIYKKVKSHEIEVIIKYGSVMNSIVFNVYNGVEHYPLSKICRSQSNGVTSDVVCDIVYRLVHDIKGRTIEDRPITQKEQDFAVKYILKTQNSYTARDLVSCDKLSQDNLDKLNGLLMVDKINCGSLY